MNWSDYEKLSWQERLRYKRRDCKWIALRMARNQMKRSIGLVGKKKTEAERGGMDLDTFKKRWLEAFAANLSQEEIEKNVFPTKEGYGQYIWHIFSRELISTESFQVGDEARRAYMQADKEGAIFIEAYWGAKIRSRPLPYMLHNPHMIDVVLFGLDEAYVVAKDFSWTYIKTHEGDLCGPYFYRKPQ